tara:strand:- start:1595 stop:1831 length:237 start_codon:yes stop_codon:yes gene_type:complete
MQKKCNSKYRFKSWGDAQQFAEDYAKQVSLLFNPMRPYWCDKHGVWHIGHDLRQKINYSPDGNTLSPNPIKDIFKEYR